MIPEELLKELLATFAVEARERLEAANRHMLALEETSDETLAAELVADIFREVHSLKGASGAVGLTDVQKLSHALESLFERARNGEPLSDQQIDVVYETLDALGELLAPESDIDVPALLAQINAAMAGIDPPDRRRRRRKPTPVVDAPEDPEAAPAPAGAPRSDETIRVSTAKLDGLMAQVGELLVSSIGAEQRLSELKSLFNDFSEWDRAWRDARPRHRKLTSDVAADAARNGHVTVSRPELEELLDFIEESDGREQTSMRALRDLYRRMAVDHRRLGQIITDLQEEVRRARMLPVGNILTAFHRMVRDVARVTGKDIALVIEGDETEVDRAVLEQLKDPLTHLLRNSIDHGIEEPADRAERGKPMRGTVSIRAFQKGNSLCIEVADDGAGIDVERVKASGVRKGVVTAEAAEAMDDAEVYELIFRSGLSTNSIITDLSGRGVGLDVVRENVERMHGLIEVESGSGGTTFRLIVPMSVASTHCLLVRLGTSMFAVPISNVARILRAVPDDIGRAEGKDVIRVDGRPVQLVRLGDALGVTSRSSASVEDDAPRRPVIVTGVAERRMAFLVDELADAKEVVVKSLPPPLYRVRYTSGATILGTGEVVPILSMGDLVRSAEQGPARGMVGRLGDDAHTKPRILVADDSIVTRTLEKNILETAGYDVRVASDGSEAWEILQAEQVDLLVTDVEMPVLGGFDLTARIRDSEKLSHLPVILVTSLDSREHRERGVEVGADAHIVKQGFNQENLLETIQALI
jgi:two-component system, chemotaxis family, sensor kinase CheA